MKNGPKINQKSIKNGPKIDQKSSKIEVWRAPGQVWRPLGPSWAIQRRLGGVLEASWRGLGGHLGGLGPRKVANMAPTWPPKRSQNQLKIDPKIDQFWDRFLIDFGSVWGAKLEPCWPPFSAQDRPSGLQDPSKTPPRRLQDVFGSPKTAQEASKPAPEPSRPRFWTIFDRFLVHF